MTTFYMYYFSRDCESRSDVASNDTNVTDYDYDFDESVYTIPMDEFVPSCLVYGATLLLGVIGNFLVIFSIAKFRQMQNVTNIFLTSLASADLMLVFVCVPIKFARFFAFTWAFGAFLCKFVYYVENFSAICSVLTLTTMSVERYYAILHPMRAKYMCTPSRARRVILLLWLLSFVLAAPIIFGRHHSLMGQGNTRLEEKLYFNCEKKWDSCIISQVYEVYMLVLVLLLPVAIMTFAYSSICRELWIVTSQRKSMTSGNGTTSSASKYKNYNYNKSASTGAPKKKKSTDDDKTRKQVIKMLVAVVLLFAICWGPYLIDNVLVSFGSLQAWHRGPLRPIRIMFALLTYINSCVNPVVYAFLSKNFRAKFKEALCSCLIDKVMHGRRNMGPQVSFQTGTTSINHRLTATARNKENDLDKESLAVYSETCLDDSV